MGFRCATFEAAQEKGWGMADHSGDARMGTGRGQGRRLPGTPEPMHVWRGAGGVPIAGDAWGEPRAPLVLLQHGGGQTRHAWKGVGEQLAAAGYYAVAFDARGHGDS